MGFDVELKKYSLMQFSHILSHVGLFLQSFFLFFFLENSNSILYFTALLIAPSISF